MFLHKKKEACSNRHPQIKRPERLVSRLRVTVLAGTYGAVCLTSNYIICNSAGIVKRFGIRNCSREGETFKSALAKKTEPALCARLGVTVLAGTYGAVCLTSNYIICNSAGIVKRISTPRLLFPKKRFTFLREAYIFFGSCRATYSPLGCGAKTKCLRGLLFFFVPQTVIDRFCHFCHDTIVKFFVLKEFCKAIH